MITVSALAAVHTATADRRSTVDWMDADARLRHAVSPQVRQDYGFSRIETPEKITDSFRWGASMQRTVHLFRRTPRWPSGQCGIKAPDRGDGRYKQQFLSNGLGWRASSQAALGIINQSLSNGLDLTIKNW